MQIHIKMALTCPRVVLVACGSFNPPTLQHVKLFNLACKELKKLRYTVCGRYMSPVHDGYSKPGLVAAKHRLEMSELATANTCIKVDPWESTQEQYQTTLEVLRHMASLHADTRVMLLCGADLLQSMNNPEWWPEEDVEKILSPTFGVVCVHRAGTDMNQLLSSGILSDYRENIITIANDDPGEISSTKVRECVKQGQPIAHLVHPGVATYIADYKLYK